MNIVQNDKGPWVPTLCRLLGALSPPIAVIQEIAMVLNRDDLDLDKSKVCENTDCEYLIEGEGHKVDSKLVCYGCWRKAVESDLVSYFVRDRVDTHYCLAIYYD